MQWQIHMSEKYNLYFCEKIKALFTKLLLMVKKLRHFKNCIKIYRINLFYHKTCIVKITKFTNFSTILN